jgi:hypothetical protein
VTESFSVTASHMFILLRLSAREDSFAGLTMQIMAASLPSPGQPIVDISRRHGNVTTEPGGPRLRECSPIPQPDKPERDNAMLLSDDELIAQLLIHTWTLTTGKTLRCDVPPHELTGEELIAFWSDDRLE